MRALLLFPAMLGGCSFLFGGSDSDPEETSEREADDPPGPADPSDPSDPSDPNDPNDPNDPTDPTDPMPTDADNDGFAEDVDCDDSNADVFPGATEVCDTIDNDCDMLVDEGDPDLDLSTAAGTFFVDADEDGFGDPSSGEVFCVAPTDRVTNDTDCDDLDPNRAPGLPEACDGVDSDCDATTVDAGISFLGTSGTLTDLTNLASGQVQPIDWTVPEPGELRVCPGTWELTIRTAVDLDVISFGTPVTTVLDGRGIAPGLVVSGAADVAISGVTMSRYQAIEGGALWCSGPASVTVDNVLFQDNRALVGGSVAVLQGCDLTLRDSSLVQTVTFRSDVGGLVQVEAATATITNTTFTGGLAETGGALTVNGFPLFEYDSVTNSTPATVTCTDCTFTGNDADLGGGVMVGNDATLTLVTSDFVDNQASFGGAILYGSMEAGGGLGSSVVVLDDVGFSGSQVTQEGVSVVHATIPEPLPYDFEGTRQTLLCDDLVGCQ